MGIGLVPSGYTEGLLTALEVQLSIVEEIKASQNGDAKLVKLRCNVA